MLARSGLVSSTRRRPASGRLLPTEFALPAHQRFLLHRVHAGLMAGPERVSIHFSGSGAAFFFVFLVAAAGCLL